MDDNIYLCETAVVVGQNFCHKSMACLVLLSDMLSKQIVGHNNDDSLPLPLSSQLGGGNHLSRLVGRHPVDGGHSVANVGEVGGEVGVCVREALSIFFPFLKHV